ncbi:MAG: YidC/Oxa1 family membrane protein insertase [Erysipelotrichaceae bacterium]|nr:YidC/Oxa1 family membrane protein insertase [Erysipelotrichaceae bacterium]MBR2552050.1 YidC/Oxa1 family membrane protein insertase [Erysipelotrichaceae bacterium]
MNKKKILLLIGIVAALLLLSGCARPMDENGNILKITNETTFSSILNDEGIFSAIFIFPLAKFINFMVPYTGVGLGIVIVTVVINLIVLALTWKSSIGAQKMQVIQPELQRIQKKYEGRDDRNSMMKMQNEMNNLYKKYDVHPFGSILSMFLQFPILIAMYNAVQRAAAVAEGTFAGMKLEVTPRAGVASGQYGYAVLFVLMILVQLLSMRVPTWLSERRAKLEAEKHFRTYRKPEGQNNMMTSMIVMVVFISILMLNWPTAMSLYYLVSSLTMILKNVLIDSIIAKQGEN